MKKIVNVILLGLILMLIEYILCIVFLYTEDIIMNGEKSSIAYNIRGSNEINLLRLIFYFPLWVLAIYFLYDKINIKYRVLKLAVCNCALYVGISVIMTSFFPFAIEYFTETFFYFLIVATLISPYILSIIPRANRLIYKI